MAVFEILVRGPERENGCYVTMHLTTTLQRCMRIAEEPGCGKHLFKVKAITIRVQAWSGYERLGRGSVGGTGSLMLEAECDDRRQMT